MINYRSLRVRLSILYVILTMSWMSAVGLFTYLYLRQALSTARAQTMVRREQRLVNYVNDAHAHLPGMDLREQIFHFMEANSTPNDLVQIFDRNGHLIYPEGAPSPSVQWPGHDCFTPCFGEIIIDHRRMRTINHITILAGRPVQLYMAGWMDEQYEMPASSARICLRRL